MHQPDILDPLRIVPIAYHDAFYRRMQGAALVKQRAVHHLALSLVEGEHGKAIHHDSFEMVKLVQHRFQHQRAAFHAIFRGRQQECHAPLGAVIAHYQLLDMLRRRAPQRHARTDIAAVAFTVGYCHDTSCTASIAKSGVRSNTAAAVINKLANNFIIIP